MSHAVTRRRMMTRTATRARRRSTQSALDPATPTLRYISKRYNGKVGGCFPWVLQAPVCRHPAPPWSTSVAAQRRRERCLETPAACASGGGRPRGLRADHRRCAPRLSTGEHQLTGTRKVRRLRNTVTIRQESRLPLTSAGEGLFAADSRWRRTNSPSLGLFAADSGKRDLLTRVGSAWLKVPRFYWNLYAKSAWLAILDGVPVLPVMFD